MADTGDGGAADTTVVDTPLALCNPGPGGPDAVAAKHRPPVHSGPDDPCPLMAFRLRYFTAREISRLMGFPDSFTFPPATSLKQQRRLLGNSLNVKVVAALMQYLLSDVLRQSA